MPFDIEQQAHFLLIQFCLEYMYMHDQWTREQWKANMTNVFSFLQLLPAKFNV